MTLPLFTAWNHTVLAAEGIISPVFPHFSFGLWGKCLMIHRGIFSCSGECFKLVVRLVIEPSIFVFIFSCFTFICCPVTSSCMICFSVNCLLVDSEFKLNLKCTSTCSHTGVKVDGSIKITMELQQKLCHLQSKPIDLLLCLLDASVC